MLISIKQLFIFAKNTDTMDAETLKSSFEKLIGEPDAKGFIGDTGITERTLDAYIGAILPTIKEDADVNDDFYNLHLGVIKAMGGQTRFMNAEFARNFKKEGVGNHPEPNVGKPNADNVPNKGGDTGGSNGDDGQISELKTQLGETLKLIKELKEERETEKKTSVRNELFGAAKKSLRSEIEDGGFNKCNDGIFEIAFSDVEYKDGMTDKEIATEAKRNYERRFHTIFGDGATPFSNHGGSGGANNSGIGSYLEQLKARDEAQRKKAEDARKSFK